jgi:hypothetical protein
MEQLTPEAELRWLKQEILDTALRIGRERKEMHTRNRELANCLEDAENKIKELKAELAEALRHPPRHPVSAENGPATATTSLPGAEGDQTGHVSRETSLWLEGPWQPIRDLSDWQEGGQVLWDVRDPKRPPLVISAALWSQNGHTLGEIRETYTHFLQLRGPVI